MHRFSLVAILLLSVFATAAHAEPLDQNEALPGAETSLETGAAKIATSDTIIGTITAIDSKTGAITIDSQVVNIKPADLRMLRLRRGDQVKVTLTKGTTSISRVAILGHQDLRPAAKQSKAPTEAPLLERDKPK
jgi:hypothetical protein